MIFDMIFLKNPIKQKNLTFNKQDYQFKFAQLLLVLVIYFTYLERLI